MNNGNNQINKQINQFTNSDNKSYTASAGKIFYL